MMYQNNSDNQCDQIKNCFKNNFINLCEYLKIDLLKLVLTFTWYWAYLGIKLTKLFELFFMVILYLPDQIYFAENIRQPNIKNSRNEKIKIIYARNNYGEITNKMKFFLRWYWENVNDESIHENNGFDMTQLTKLFNCSMLYCSYLLIKNDDKLTPEMFLNNMKSILITNEDTPPIEAQEKDEFDDTDSNTDLSTSTDSDVKLNELDELDELEKVLEKEKNKVYANKKDGYFIKQCFLNGSNKVITKIKNLCFDHVEFME